MSRDSDDTKPPPAPGWQKMITSDRSNNVEDTNMLTDTADGSSHRRHTTPGPTPNRRRMDSRFNLQPSAWNSPAVNQSITQTTQGDTSAPRSLTRAGVPRIQTHVAGLESQPSTAIIGRRQVTVRRQPCDLLATPIKQKFDVKNEGLKPEWEKLTAKSSFSLARSGKGDHVAFRNGETLSIRSRLHIENFTKKRPPGETQSEPRTKRRRVAFDTANVRTTDAPTTTTDDVIRNNSVPKAAASHEHDEDSDDDHRPLRSIFEDPIVLGDYRGYDDSPFMYGDPLDDYRGIPRRAAPVEAVDEDVPDDWTCIGCGTDNPHDETYCGECSKNRPKYEPIGWGNLFASSKSMWKCLNCTSYNPPETTKCLSCEVCKHNDDPADTGFGGNGLNENHNNAASGSSSAANIVAETAAKPTDSATQQFSFGSGGTTVPENQQEPAKFMFGAAPSNPLSTSPPFSFGGTRSDPSDASVKPPSVSSGKAFVPSDPFSKSPSFSFGVPPDSSNLSTSSESPDPSSKPPSFSFGITSAPSEPSPKPPPFVFGSTPAPLEPSPKPSFVFGSNPAPSDPSPKPPSFVFGSTSAPSDPPPKPPSFSFGNASGNTQNNEETTSATKTARHSFKSTPSNEVLDEKSDSLSVNINQSNSSAAVSSNNGNFVQNGVQSQPFVFGATTETRNDDDLGGKRSEPFSGFGSGGSKLPPSSDKQSSVRSSEQPKPSKEDESFVSRDNPFHAVSSFDQAKNSENNALLPGFAFGSSQPTLPTNPSSSGQSLGQPFATPGPSSTFNSDFGATPVPNGTAVLNHGPTFGSTGTSSNSFGASSTLPPFGNTTQGPTTFGAPAFPPTLSTPAPGFSASAPASGFGAIPVPPFGVQPAPAPMFAAAPPFGTPSIGAPNPFGSSAPAPGSFGTTPAPTPSAPAFGGFAPAPLPNYGQAQAPNYGAPAAAYSFGHPSQQPPSLQAPNFGAPAAANSFGQPSQQPPSLGAPPNFGAQAPSIGVVGAADGGFNMGSGGAVPKRRIVRVRR